MMILFRQTHYHNPQKQRTVSTYAHPGTRESGVLT